MFFALFLSTAVQIRSHILPPQGANEAAGGTILLSRYGRAAVLSRYGKRDGGAERREFNQSFGEGPWFLCKRTLDGQFLRCRSPLQRRKK
uniref:Secreted protein n=1 Tax=Globodera pallida TaxID=36090 RepID=A0A183BNY8_GLOPA